jgi:hypothetical protein
MDAHGSHSVVTQKQRNRAPALANPWPRAHTASTSGGGSRPRRWPAQRSHSLLLPTHRPPHCTHAYKGGVRDPATRRSGRNARRTGKHAPSAWAPPSFTPGLPQWLSSAARSSPHTTQRHTMCHPAHHTRHHTGGHGHRRHAGEEGGGCAMCHRTVPSELRKFPLENTRAARMVRAPLCSCLHAARGLLLVLPLAHTRGFPTHS